MVYDVTDDIKKKKSTLKGKDPFPFENWMSWCYGV
jgi:hypothetical protein